MKRKNGFKVNIYGGDWFDCKKCSRSVKYRSGAFWEMIGVNLEPHKCKPDVIRMRRRDVDPDVIAQYEREANRRKRKK